MVRRLLAALPTALAPRGRMLLLLSSLTDLDLAAALPQWSVRAIATESHFFERLTVYEVS